MPIYSDINGFNGSVLPACNSEISHSIHFEFIVMIWNGAVDSGRPAFCRVIDLLCLCLHGIDVNGSQYFIRKNPFGF